MAAKTRQLAPRTVAAIDALESMWSEIDKARGEALSERPPMSFTVAEYASRFGVPIPTADGQVKRLVVAEKVTKHRCFIVLSDGSRRAMNVYVPKASQ